MVKTHDLLSVLMEYVAKGPEPYSASPAEMMLRALTIMSVVLHCLYHVIFIFDQEKSIPPSRILWKDGKEVLGKQNAKSKNILDSYLLGFPPPSHLRGISCSTAVIWPRTS